MHSDENQGRWAIKVTPKKDIYWPYFGLPAYLGCYDFLGQKGFAVGVDRHKIVSSIPIKREDIQSFQVEELPLSSKCRLQMDLIFDSFEQATTHVISIETRQ